MAHDDGNDRGKDPKRTVGDSASPQAGQVTISTIAGDVSEDDVMILDVSRTVRVIQVWRDESGKVVVLIEEGNGEWRELTYDEEAPVQVVEHPAAKSQPVSLSDEQRECNEAFSLLYRIFDREASEVSLEAATEHSDAIAELLERRTGRRRSESAQRSKLRSADADRTARLFGLDDNATIARIDQDRTDDYWQED